MTVLEDDAYDSDNGSDKILEAPCYYGLWISWEDGSMKLQLVLDENQSDLHPHIHTPQLQNVHIRKGGGSGATVFSGDLGDNKLIWKHGDYKDMRDVFSLAEIERDLLRRSEFAPDGAENLRSRIPRFAGVFISPAAFRTRSEELWSSLRNTILRWNEALPRGDEDGVALHKSSPLPRPVSHQDLAGEQYRRIKLLEGATDVDVLRREVRIYVEKMTRHPENREQVLCDYETIKQLVQILVRLQAKHMWKFSVAQVAIGGATPRTGSSLLTSGELRGDTLNDLLDQFIGILRSLREVTSLEEKEAVEKVREEVESMPEDIIPEDLSPLSDTFVGSAIVKNWHSEKGRYKVARDLAPGLCGEGDIILTAEEELPANALGKLLWGLRGTMCHVFAVVPSHDAPFYQMHIVWKELLRDASNLKGKAAIECVWTCGLTDAGLHNMFFSGGRLWLFDLGKPNYQPLPAFLTKFLMSFFHALGMEDTPDGSSWVNRFKVSEIGGMLELTERTKELLPIAHEAYTLTLDRLVDEIFEGEEAVRGLMIKYTILQLLSDASFCVQKWQIKGGGSRSYDNHHSGLEKWLWRALWDIFVATDVCNTYVPSLTQQR